MVFTAPLFTGPFLLPSQKLDARGSYDSQRKLHLQEQVVRQEGAKELIMSHKYCARIIKEHAEIDFLLDLGICDA